MRANNYVVRAKTNVAQRSRAETVLMTKAFVHEMIPKFIGPNRHQDYIINMDQTPIYFDATPSTTLELRGTNSINFRTSSSSTIRVTLAVTVTASGKSLMPMLVFRGKPNGTIFKSFGTYPNGCEYLTQKAAWMDEPSMLKWIDQVLAPYILTAPAGIHPIILLDSYGVHKMKSVVDKIQNLGCEVQHITPGCTALGQPVDVGIGKPLKNRVRRHWEVWMLETGVDAVIAKRPKREVVSQWCIDGLNDLSETIVKNSWRHGEFSYFPNENETE